MKLEALDKFGVVSDEIHDDPSVAFAVAEELGMRYIDLNSVWGKPVTELSYPELKELAGLAHQHQLQTTMVGGLAFKSMLIHDLAPDDLLASQEFLEHMEILKKSLDIAAVLEAPLVRVHAFRWPHVVGFGNPMPRFQDGGKIPAKVLETITAGLEQACRLAEAYDSSLGLENVRSTYANSGQNTSNIVNAVNHKKLNVVWDPGNAYVSGESQDNLTGYRSIQSHLVHFHVKDAKVLDSDTGLTAWECVGQGEIDYATQFKALLDDGYNGVICLETHWKNAPTKEEASRQSFKGLQKARTLALERHLSS